MEEIELPIGLGMALAMNETAMHRFEALSAEKKQEIIRQSQQVQSRSAMQALVRQLTANG